jgi:molybdate transport system ATP-binding protein
VWVPPHRRGVGVVFQDARLFPHWSTEKNLRAGMPLDSTGPFSFDAIVDLLEIRGVLDRSVHHLSGGETQRIALGRALLAHPRLLLMDEPVSGLDARLKGQVLPFIERVHRELQLPCLLVSHSLPEILELTDQILWMSQGAVRGQGRLMDLVECPDAFESFRRAGLMSRIQLTSDGAWVGVRPDEVMLASGPVSGLSAQHQIPGILRSKIDHEAGTLCLLETECGLLMADVTRQAVTDLDLCVEKRVTVLFKASAVRPTD